MWLFPVLLGLQACSGGGGGGDTPSIESPANRAPLFAEMADQAVDEGARLALEIAASDPDGEYLTLDTGTLPAFITIERLTDASWHLEA
ncbi:MAG: hypothetical protein PVF50_02550, partial [Gammaproteobacteria bacterium]